MAKKMLLRSLIRDNNDVNEKTLIGMVSFGIMIVFAIVDLVTGFFGKDLVIKEYIYTSFLYLTLGSFGISSIDKYTNVKHLANSDKPDEEDNGKKYDNYNNYENERYYN